MPHSAASKIQGQNCLAVASLHTFGGPLAGARRCWLLLWGWGALFSIMNLQLDGQLP